MNKQKRTAIYRRLQERDPSPSTELDWIDPFELLVAVVLSAQATDVSVNKATAELFPVANTPEKILKLGVARLKRYIRTIGLFNSKAENIIKTCRILIEEHGGQVPRAREALEKLPGVGRKTANVIPQHRLRRAHHRRGHAHLPRRQPHPNGQGEKPPGGGDAPHPAHAPGVPQGRPPLADPARPLRLQGAQARVPDLRHRPTCREFPDKTRTTED